MEDRDKKRAAQVAADVRITGTDTNLHYTASATTTAEDASHALGAEDASLLIIQAKHCTFWPLERARAED